MLIASSIKQRLAEAENVELVKGLLREHLPRVLNMSRFLIRPTVRCPNLASHVLGLCARRISADYERTALVVQDTTDLNLSTRSHCEGLGQIGTNQTGAKSQGLRLHSSLALNPDGLPLGLLQLHGYAPQSAKGKDPDRPIEQKESYRCLESTEAKLFDELAAVPLARRVSIPVPRQREHRSKPSVPGRVALAARQAHVEIR